MEKELNSFNNQNLIWVPDPDPNPDPFMNWYLKQVPNLFFTCQNIRIIVESNMRLHPYQNTHIRIMQVYIKKIHKNSYSNKLHACYNKSTHAYQKSLIGPIAKQKKKVGLYSLSGLPQHIYNLNYRSNYPTIGW